MRQPWREQALLVQRGGLGTRTGVWLLSGSVAGPSRPSRLYLRVLETPEEPLGCGGFHIQCTLPAHPFRAPR